MPTATIDGQKITVPEGATIMQAADELGIYIPRYCYHPGLSIAGCCRICLVEVEKMPKPAISCYTAVTDGMVVHTDSEKAVTARRAVLEFLLLNHPIDCPVCDQAGECWLQEYYMMFGLYDSLLNEDKVRKRKAVVIGPYIILDTERCILCTRCVRFCDEITKTHELGIFERGDISEIWLYPGKELDNNYSGNVADICPVGALTDRDFRFQCRVWYLDAQESICPSCATGCNIEIHYNLKRPHAAGGRRLIRLKPRYNPEVNQWWMCDEGRYGYKFVDAPNRIQDPLVRENGGLRPIPWKEAIGRVATALKRVLAGSGPASIGVIPSRWSTNEELYLVKKLFSQDLGIPNIDYRLPGNIVGDDDGSLIRADKAPNSKGAQLVGLIPRDGLSAADMLAAASQGTLRFLYVIQQDLVKAYGHEKVEAAAKGAELIIYQGTNLNPTSEFAHLVLPGATFAEKDGTFTNYAGRVQKISEAFPPLGRARPDWAILRDLAVSLGLPYRYQRTEDVFRELAEKVTSFKGLTYSALGKQGVAVSGVGM